jgi:hypothetical protein
LELGQTLRDRLAGGFGLALRDGLKLDLPPTFMSVPVPSPLVVFLGVVAVGTFMAYVLSRVWPDLGVKPIIAVAGVLAVCLLTVRLGGLGHYEDYRQIKYTLDKYTDLSGVNLERQTGDYFRRFAERKPTEPDSAELFTRDLIKTELEDQLRSDDFKIALYDEADEDELPPERGPIWPVILASALFLYLWWLAAMCFDLLVVWNHYIRNSAVIARLKARTPGAQKQPVA